MDMDMDVSKISDHTSSNSLKIQFGVEKNKECPESNELEGRGGGAHTPDSY